MSWTVTWNGKEYDVDPNEMSGLEMSLIKIRTGFNYTQLLDAIGELDADAMRVLFWTVDRRENKDLNFSEYDGPPMRVILEAVGSLGKHLVSDLKALLPDEDAEGQTPTTETPGGPSSPSGSPSTETATGTTS